MELRAHLEAQIAQELQQKYSFMMSDIVRMVETGQSEEAADYLLFFSSPREFPAQSRQLRRLLSDRIAEGASDLQKNCISFLTHLTLDLSSMLAKWNLQNRDLHGDRVLTDVEIRDEITANLRLLTDWETLFPVAARELLAGWRDAAKARFIAEKAAQPEVEAEKLVSDAICAYVHNMAQAFRQSNLRRIAEMRVAGLNGTELGNDYAAFLKYTMYLGASFVTTNPVLVDIAWDADPAYWDAVMDKLVTANPHANEEELARLATLEVVLANMRLLRPIFLLTKGGMGCVSLQVNPKKHGDAQAMITDATLIYEELRTRLNGGVPNVVFKLPGTLAGLEACRALTGKGIGVNITVNFGLFQQLRFAEVIREGQAIFATLTEMNGRLAFPVRDELLGKLPALTAHGISQADALEAAAWSGVAVVKKLQKLLTEKGYDLKRIKPLVASLRIYKDSSGYDRLPSAYPDVTEAVGTSIITIFPDVRHAFDREIEMDLKAEQIHEPVPTRVLDVLTHSEIFKQAYYVTDTSWVQDEEERFRPNQILTLEDEAAVAAWPPVYNTLKQFADSYDHFVQRLVSRRKGEQ
ncbi:MAG: transaldolase family protein [Anaerolineae bacterium]